MKTSNVALMKEYPSGNSTFPVQVVSNGIGADIFLAGKPLTIDQVKALILALSHAVADEGRVLKLAMSELAQPLVDDNGAVALEVKEVLDRAPPIEIKPLPVATDPAVDVGTAPTP